MLLPNGDRAEVALSRLADYLLNPAHPTGKHKARVFAAALGLDRSSAEFLRTWLIAWRAKAQQRPTRKTNTESGSSLSAD
jgi:hypothetical protein